MLNVELQLLRTPNLNQASVFNRGIYQSSVKMFDLPVSVKVEKHLLSLINKVKCSICSNILLMPFESSCHHVACARCFSPKNECPLCKSLFPQNELRPNETLSKRTAAVLQIVKAYETYSGKKVLSKPSSKDTSTSDIEDSEDWLFKKDTKFAKKYEKKKHEASSSQLMSVSQNDTPLIFPGEAIHTSQQSVESEIDKNINPIDKVQEWLSVSQNNVGATIYRGPVKNLYPDRMYEDFFQRKVGDLYKDNNPEVKTRSSTRLANKTPVKNEYTATSVKLTANSGSDKKDSFISPTKSAKSTSTANSAKRQTRASKQTEPSSKTPIKRDTSSNFSNNEDSNKSPSKSVTETASSVLGSGKKNDRKSGKNIKSLPTPTKKTAMEPPHKDVELKNTSNSENDTDLSNNCSFKATDNEVKNVFSKILQNKNMQKLDEDHLVANESKDRNSWKNVKKMKKVLNKPLKSLLKKLDISVAEKCVSANENQNTKHEKEMPFQSSKHISQIISGKHVSPEAIRRQTSIISVDSNSEINLISPSSSDKVDKDYLACQAAILASKHQMSPVHSVQSKLVNESCVSEPPLTHLSPVSSKKAKSVNKIVKKLENEMMISNILKDFEIEGEEDESEVSDLSVVNSTTSASPKPSNTPSQGKSMLDNFKINSSELNKTSHTVPFVCRGKFTNRSRTSQMRKIPFYYKSKCVTKDWYQIPQEGLNIQLHRSNTLTSIFIRNQPLEDVSQTSLRDSMRVVETRDAQTSPISFLTDNMVEKVHNEPTESDAIPCSRNLPLPTVSYRMHPNLQRFTNCINGNDNLKVFTTETNNLSTSADPGCSKHLETSNTKSNKSQVSSPPLIVSEPIPDSLFDIPIKRKLPQCFSPAKSYSKRTKISTNIEYPLKDDVNILFSSQTQEIQKTNHTATNESQPEKLDKAHNKVVENEKYFDDIIQCSPNMLEDANTPIEKKDDEIEKKCSKKYNPNQNPEPCSFIPSQRKMVEDETDLRLVSMEMEPIIEHTENIFTATEEKSQAFMQNTMIENDKNLESLMDEVSMKQTKQDNSIMNDGENPLSEMFDKNTNVFSQESHKSKVDDGLVSKLNLPQSMQQLQKENSKFLESGDIIQHAERTVELSPQEEMLLTPSFNEIHKKTSLQNHCTPIIVEDDSDNSMVEDTPQKTRRFITVKKSDCEVSLRKSDSRRTSIPKLTECENDLMIQNRNAKKTDTPVSISKFSDDIKVCSTPVVCARRSLSYKDNLSAISEDEEFANTIMKNSSHRQSTSASFVEKQLLEEAFESKQEADGRNSAILGAHRKPIGSQLTTQKRTLSERSQSQSYSQEPYRKICIACSCLVKAQINKVQNLVAKVGSKFTSDFVDDLTHLVVKVDENNRAMRSIKYIQALAAGKWIVSYAWIEKCIATNKLVPEEEYEVLDSSGEMGPFISRTSKSKIFCGFTFYCCPPFSVIGCDILMNILKSAGAAVVESIEEIEIKDPNKICILLAEFSNPESDRFLGKENLLMNHKVVPINFDWITESLGEGRLCNAGNYLLIPRNLLPTVHWPLNLVADESMDDYGPI